MASTTSVSTPGSSARAKFGAATEIRANASSLLARMETSCFKKRVREPALSDAPAGISAGFRSRFDVPRRPARLLLERHRNIGVSRQPNSLALDLGYEAVRYVVVVAFVGPLPAVLLGELDPIPFD